MPAAAAKLRAKWGRWRGAESGKSKVEGRKTELDSANSSHPAERKLMQARVAAILGLDQPKVSAPVRGRVEGHSVEWLVRFFNALSVTHRDQRYIEPQIKYCRERAITVNA
jgi:predicted XRE-type DNA-binding protein